MKAVTKNPTRSSGILLVSAWVKEPQSTQILVVWHASDTYIIKIRPSSIVCGANGLQQPLLPRWIAITHWTGHLKKKKIVSLTAV